MSIGLVTDWLSFSSLLRPLYIVYLQYPLHILDDSTVISSQYRGWAAPCFQSPIGCCIRKCEGLSEYHHRHNTLVSWQTFPGDTSRENMAAADSRDSGAKNKGYLSSLWAAGARGPPTSHPRPRRYVAGCCGFSRTRSYQYQNLRTHNYMLQSCYQDIITLSPHSCDSLMSWSSSHHRQTHGLQAWAAHPMVFQIFTQSRSNYKHQKLWMLQEIEYCCVGGF